MKLKNLLIFTIIFYSYISYNATLKEINYKNGEIDLIFDEKITTSPKVNNTQLKSNNISYNILETTLKNNSLSNNVEKSININDKFFKTIVVDEIKNNEIIVYSYSQYGYKSRVVVNDNIIKIKAEKHNLPKRISPLTKKTLTIALDAGHGGHDSGARGFGKMEKDIALEIVLKLAENLKRDHNIILTRKDDTFISLSERPEIGNKNSADLFVSIHLNASTNPDANGAEIFYFSKESNPYTKKLIEFEESYDEISSNKVSLISQILGDFFINRTREKSAKLATYILDNYATNLSLRKRGVFGANFAVLRGSESSSILIELGFITNNNDLNKLISELGQEQAVIAIADSIREHFEE